MKVCYDQRLSYKRSTQGGSDTSPYLQVLTVSNPHGRGDTERAVCSDRSQESSGSGHVPVNWWQTASPPL